MLTQDMLIDAMNKAIATLPQRFSDPRLIKAKDLEYRTTVELAINDLAQGRLSDAMDVYHDFIDEARI